MQSLEQLRRLTAPAAVTFVAGQGNFPKAVVQTERSRAEVYLHGAHVTAFETQDGPPVLFLSRTSYFAPGKAIRGGVPICFPWFGPRSGDVAHGFARIVDWDLVAAESDSQGGISLRFDLPPQPDRGDWPKFKAQFTVRVAQSLTLEISVLNEDPQLHLDFEACLHSYFLVGDVREISLRGLGGVRFLDKTRDNALDTQELDALRIAQQTDRTYLDTTGPVEIRDPVLGRTLRIDKSGSASTVVWNPWTTQVLPDLAPDEYLRMVCVESGNVDRNRVSLAPGQSSRLEVVISTLGSV